MYQSLQPRAFSYLLTFGGIWYILLSTKHLGGFFVDFAAPVPVENKKKPFAIASITLILSVFLVFTRMIWPYLKAIILGRPMQVILDEVFDFPTLLSYSFIMLFILCVAVATFFKKSTIFLIGSLFMLGLAYAAFAMLDLSSLLDRWDDYAYFQNLLILSFVPYIAAGLCMALGFILLGLTAIIARKKPSNLWILSTVLFGIAALVSAFIFLRTTSVAFEDLGWALRRWLHLGIGSASIEVYDFFLRCFAPVFYGGTVVLHFVTSILLGLYLKKLAKQ